MFNDYCDASTLVHQRKVGGPTEEFQPFWIQSFFRQNWWSDPIPLDLQQVWMVQGVVSPT